MGMPRASGILLHPTSLPGRFGIGDIGPAAFRFLDLLTETGQRWWQMLPLGPTGYGNSPYQSYSSHGGNPLLISPESLAAEGLLTAKDLAEFPRFSDDRVDFDAVASAKDRLFRKAFTKFKLGSKDFKAYVGENASWLEDFALFMALKQEHGGRAWYDWEDPLVRREPKAVARWRQILADSIRYYQFLQFMFDRQWRTLRDACIERSIKLIGDLPIFVALDSVDVWARPDLFHLDANHRCTVVAGVPPDYFSETGQLWGNPLYRWEVHEAEGFAWWIGRLRALVDKVDLIRLDHFRGFAAYWEVPAGNRTAEHGRWVKAPGEAFLKAVEAAFEGLPLVAEDLGEITPDVYQLRDEFNLPGMRVIQFGLGGEPNTDDHLPYKFVPHCIAYTGTHDNDTTLGWFLEPARGDQAQRAYHNAQRAFARRYLGTRGDEIHWDVIRAVMASPADTAIIPLQDILGLGSAARMNLPGRSGSYWNWRFREGQIRPGVREQLADLTAVSGRWNGVPPEPYAPPKPPVKPEPVAARPKGRSRKK